MGASGGAVSLDDLVLGKPRQRLQGVNVLREGAEEKTFRVDETLEVMARRRLHPGVEKLFGERKRK